MANYNAAVPGNDTLSQAESSIQFEESKCSAFVSSTLDMVKMMNIVVFQDLDTTLPNDFKLTRNTDPVPVGYTKIWQGAFLIIDPPRSPTPTNVNVIAWRKN